MKATIVMLAWIAALLYVVIKTSRVIAWRTQTGEPDARAEYGRIVREQPGSTDAKISEAEFVKKFIADNKPNVWVWILISVGLFLIGGPAACTIAAKLS